MGNAYHFKGADNSIIGYVEELGGKHIYKAANNSIIGYAEKIGGRTEYKASNNAGIGSADTTAMPFRPIPFERHLKKLKAANRDGVCLTYITKIRPDS